LTKKNPTAPHALRLRAVMECLNRDYVKPRGGQKKFAVDIGVNYGLFNKIARGHMQLSKQVALAIFDRFKAEGVSLEFLFRGHAGYGNAEFEQKLLEWQHHNGKKIFSDDYKADRVADDVVHQVPLPHEAPTIKAKTAVDPIARLQTSVDTVGRISELTMRSGLAITALGVVITKAQELIAELQRGNEAKPGTKPG
jgi:hypothetical protein